MVITYFGKQYVKITQGDLTIAINIPGKDSDYAKLPHFGANIVLSSNNHPDYNGMEYANYGDKVAFPVYGPGAYEVNSVFVTGTGSKINLDKKDYINTSYVMTIDSLNVVFLGALQNADIKADMREAVGIPDVLFVPIGGKSVIDAKAAAKLANSLDAKIVIPLDYGDDQNADALKTFLKEAGAEGTKPEEKLTLKRKDVEGKEGEVMVLATNS